MGSRAGRPNKATATREAALSKGGLLPLGYLLQILRNEGETQAVRIDAAKAAAPYVHPRLNSIQGDADKPLVVQQIVRKIVE